VSRVLLNAVSGSLSAGARSSGAQAGYYEAERGSTAYFAIDKDLPAVGFNNLFHDRESKTHSARLFRIGFESLKDFRKPFLWDADAGIAHPAANFVYFSLLCAAAGELRQ
jgi:hypothetical protein